MYVNYGEENKHKKEIRKMAVVEMKSLLEAGVHFGHLKKVWNPKMKKYIFQKEERSDIHVINLDITVSLLKKLMNLLKNKLKLERQFYLLEQRNKLKMLSKKKLKDVVCSI